MFSVIFRPGFDPKSFICRFSGPDLIHMRFPWWSNGCYLSGLGSYAGVVTMTVEESQLVALLTSAREQLRQHGLSEEISKEFSQKTSKGGSLAQVPNNKTKYIFCANSQTGGCSGKGSARGSSCFSSVQGDAPSHFLLTQGPISRRRLQI